MRLPAADLTMIKCRSFQSPNFYRQSTVGAEDDENSVAGDRRASDLVEGGDFVASAASLFKDYLRDSLSEDEGINSSVAIDNKIEQAMDLVKSHLMFAVREEVEILKEQIKELLEKNRQLEYENEVLRADATPETLAKLQSGVGVIAI